MKRVLSSLLVMTYFLSSVAIATTTMTCPPPPSGTWLPPKNQGWGFINNITPPKSFPVPTSWNLVQLAWAENSGNTVYAKMTCQNTQVGFPFGYEYTGTALQGTCQLGSMTLAPGASGWISCNSPNCTVVCTIKPMH